MWHSWCGGLRSGCPDTIGTNESSSTEITISTSNSTPTDRTITSTVVAYVLSLSVACMTKFSSQHILWQVLIDNRPLHWPPWQRTLTSSEIDDVARHESPSRCTVSDAIDLVSERVKSQLLLRDECLRLRDELGLPSKLEEDFLQRLNSARMATCKSDDDPFLNDESPLGTPFERFAH
jgi:hypothetical protein